MPDKVGILGYKYILPHCFPQGDYLMNWIEAGLAPKGNKM